MSYEVLPSATQMGAKAPKPQKAGYRIVQAVMHLCRDRSIPEPDRIARSALGQQTLNLLKGGHDERDVLETALDLAGRFTLYDRHKALMTLQNTVVGLYEDRRIAEHDRMIFDSRSVAPDVAAAVGRPLDRVPARPGSIDARDSARWSRRCDAPGCPRTALYGTDRCSEHS